MNNQMIRNLLLIKYLITFKEKKKNKVLTSQLLFETIHCHSSDSFISICLFPFLFVYFHCLNESKLLIFPLFIPLTYFVPLTNNQFILVPSVSIVGLN